MISNLRGFLAAGVICFLCSISPMAAQECDPTHVFVSDEENRSSYMRGVPPAPEFVVTADEEWYMDDDQASWAFQNSSLIHNVSVISRGSDPVKPLKCATEGILSQEYLGLDQAPADLKSLLRDLRVDGFIALHNGEVVAEAYYNGFGPDDRHIIFSVTKSVLGTLVGVLVGTGELNPNAEVTERLPELLQSGFAGATVRDLLDMVAGAEWNKVRSDPNSLVNVNATAGGFIEAPEGFDFGNTLEFLATLGRQNEHGEKYTYNASNTEALAWTVSRVSGQPWQDELADQLWSKIGAEKDAIVAVDGFGHGFATAGMSATLRDLARFASLYSLSPVNEEVRLIPDEWIAEILANNPIDRNNWDIGSDRDRRPMDAYYKNHIRVLDPEKGEFYASGFMGQKLYINRESDVVIVILSTVRDREVIDFHVPLMRQIVDSLE